MEFNLTEKPSSFLTTGIRLFSILLCKKNSRNYIINGIQIRANFIMSDYFDIKLFHAKREMKI